MASIKQRGNSWILSWREPILYTDGSKRSGQTRISLGEVTRQQAERALEIKKFELSTGVVIDNHGMRSLVTKAGVPTLREFYDKHYRPWFAMQHQSSIDKLDRCMNRDDNGLGAIRLTSITTVVMEQWKTARYRAGRGGNRGGPLADATVRREMGQYLAMIKRAIKWNIIAENPCLGVSPPPSRKSALPQLISRIQLDLIYGADPEHSHWWRFIANTGLRRSEAMKARRSDIWEDDDGQLVLRVESSEDATTKTRKARTIPLNDTAVKALESMDDDFLFPRIRLESVSRIFRQAAQTAKVRASIKALRHTFASTLVSSGVPLNVVQELMGHADITTTEIYLWTLPSAGNDAVRKISL